MADGIQFDKAEFASPAAARTCVVCKAPITETYFEAGGHVLCPTCAARYGAEQPTPALIGRAALWGAGVAAAGTIVWYLIAKYAHLELAIIAIAIGYFVGKYVRRGAGGRGGGVFQGLAMALTYLSITSSYALFALDRMDADDPVSVGQLFAHALTAPFAGKPDVLGLIIIGIGLYEAWKLTRAIPIAGPFRVTPPGPPVINSAEPPSGPATP
jgi:hypothetical protein